LAQSINLGRKVSVRTYFAYLLTIPPI